MGASRLRLIVLSSVAFVMGCDRGEPSPLAKTAPPPAAPTTDASAAARDAEPSDVATDTPPATAPATGPAAERLFAEDLTVDAERDPRVRVRARELNALPVTGMKGLKVGDDVILLVRGDRGGGTIYGSGPYTIDSQIRKAVVHNGALKHQELGLVRVKVIKHDGEHASTPQNGITPTKHGKYHTSYTIEKVEVP